MTLSQTDVQKIFNPVHVAVIGVSTGDYKFGGTSFLMKLQEGGFPGILYPINPKAQEIRGLKAYPDLKSLPVVPDLAIVCVAARLVPGILEDCASIGLLHVHILTSGFRESGLEEGKLLEEQIVAIAKDKGLKVIGPNCMGPYCPSAGLTAWGAIPGLSGSVGIISQSGGLTQRLTEYTSSLGIGVDKAVSFGNAAVLDSTDFLEILAEDKDIRVIAMYLESVKDARKLLQIAKAANQKKPVILWKGGESQAGAATAASHTGAMSGSQKLWQAFYRQTGVTRVRSMNECVDAIMAFSLLTAPAGHGVFLIGGGGGNSVANSDTFNRQGFEVPPLSEPTMDFLSRSVPTAGSIAGNPLDMWRTFIDADYLAQVLELGYKDSAISIIVVDRLIPRMAYHFPDLADPTPETIAYLKNRQIVKPTVFTIDSDGGDPELADMGARLRAKFCRAGIPAFPSARRAARALRHLYHYHTRQKRSD
ncbi:Acetyl-CoA synthetase (ADP-forming) alpha and beta chains, putative [Olavius sp. associated proteobacterium Delta 1]|nr:Acetyl-CoA synthetase (ADP-forming) alpha and beta chains, putative [Olavius sp. associated proteobacterium Delta 1]